LLKADKVENIAVPNFAVIGQTVADVWRFLDFRDSKRTPFQNF